MSAARFMLVLTSRSFELELFCAVQNSSASLLSTGMGARYPGVLSGSNIEPRRSKHTGGQPGPLGSMMPSSVTVRSTSSREKTGVCSASSRVIDTRMSLSSAASPVNKFD